MIEHYVTDEELEAELYRAAASPDFPFDLNNSSPEVREFFKKLQMLIAAEDAGAEQSAESAQSVS